ncbi:MAG: hypothetical protein ABEH43_03760, partial [Flavobacteriales bacterium]
WPETTNDGDKVIKTTMGLSYLYSPFFFMGHIYAKFTEYDAGGYSIPYKLTMQLGAVFYLAIGLIFLRKLLKNYFNETVTTLTILAVTAGTNLFYYTTHESGMPHLYDFTLISIFLWLI